MQHGWIRAHGSTRRDTPKEKCERFGAPRFSYSPTNLGDRTPLFRLNHRLLITDHRLLITDLLRHFPSFPFHRRVVVAVLKNLYNILH